MPRCSGADRQRAWITRASTYGEVKSWRPQQMHRLGAKISLAELDNQLRVSTPLPGFCDLATDPNNARWHNWRSWPHITVTHDIGSDILCATHAAEQHSHLCWTKSLDVDHGAQRSLIEALQGAGVHELFLRMVLNWNLPCGPANNEYSFHQLQDASEPLARSHTAKYCVSLDKSFADI